MFRLDYLIDNKYWSALIKNVMPAEPAKQPKMKDPIWNLIKLKLKITCLLVPVRQRLNIPQRDVEGRKLI